MPTYRITFTGRRRGAIGITYAITAERTAADFEAARLALYDDFESISGARYEVVGREVPAAPAPLADEPDPERAGQDRYLADLDRDRPMPLAGLRCRYTDCPEAWPVAAEGEQVTCLLCRASLGLPEGGGNA